MPVNSKQNGSNGHSTILDPLFDAEFIKSHLRSGGDAPRVFPIQPEDFASKDPSDGSNKEYRKVPYEYVDPVWQIGWTDGRYGQSEKINENVLRVEGKLQWIARLESAEAKIAQSSGHVAAQASAKAWLQPKLDAVSASFQKLNEQRQEHYQEFSRKLGVFYAFFAVLLLAADIPLSLRLVASGIGVTTWFREAGQKFTPDDMFLNPRVFTHLWEAILLALGIAALGIFVKFYLDTIVFRDNRKNPHSWLAVILMTLTLFLLVGSIGILGMYRAEQQQEQFRQKIADDITQKHLQKIHDGVEKQLPADLSKEIDDAVKAAPQASRWQSGTFIALTLLLPIIAGFCFSTSGRKLRNASQYKATAAALKQLEEQSQKITEQLCEAEENLQFQKERLAREKTDPEIRDSLADLPRLVYLHGYERGRNVPETLEEGATLYERCRKSVEKQLAKKARTRLWRPITGE
jgi:hypothetical protein